MTKPTEVRCLDCDRKLKTSVSRARHIGEGCWRKRQAEARARSALVPLPGFTRHGDLAGLDGPSLLDQLTEDGPHAS
ncbi:DUF6011 domain-containing protein [Micromonospora craniellae]|uniref:Uncharacterized protein n=1 Tax=Micromonospora craniellae TaxID=2294034 RepID=A0A372G1Y2_9ACTN|nr:DUF6011 domain-containing protein [Micromonospora craniellae]QOC89855.1 hypothetical protein ID554_16590 [Micromonospora craniellae]RFS47003.1 hypothetical protein D0Q02_07520 [Micromonospora craniellae]